MSAVVYVLSLTSLPAHENLLETIAAVSRQIEASPDDARLYLQRGELHRLHEEWRLAATDYDRAAQLDPALALVGVARGHMLLESGRPGDALPVLNEVVDRKPIAARLVRARVFSQLGRPADAATDYLEAIKLSSRPEPDLHLACARAFSAAGDHEQALHVLDDACTTYGSTVSLELAALDLEVMLERFDDALKRLDRLTANAARKESWFLRRGEILETMQRADDARAAYSEARLALAAVPPARRHTAASMELETRIDAALERVAGIHKQQ